MLSKDKINIKQTTKTKSSCLMYKLGQLSSHVQTNAYTKCKNHENKEKTFMFDVQTGQDEFVNKRHNRLDMLTV